MMLFLQLFFEFFKTGLFAVGGGLATLPFLSDISERTGWFTSAQLADMIAVGESTPGPIGINMATYTGFVTAGIPGAITATIGLVFPSVIVIVLIARILQKFKTNPYVSSAFLGLRPCSIGLIAAAGLLVAKMAVLKSDLFYGSGINVNAINLKACILALVLFVLMRYVPFTKKLHPVVFIACSAAIGILFHF